MQSIGEGSSTRDVKIKSRKPKNKNVEKLCVLNYYI